MLIIKKLIQSCFLVIGVIGLVSCSSDPSPELNIQSVSIYTEADTNQDSAIAVDLVLVYDTELVKILSKLSAAKYFAMSEQLILDNPSLLEIWHWELVPGQIVQDFVPPQEEGDAFAGFVFANYISAGDHRLKVSPQGIIKVLLTKTDIKNLATSDTPALRTGETASNASVESSQTSEASCGKKLGPIHSPQTQTPCGKAVQSTSPCSPPIQTKAPCPPQYKPAGKPMIITSRPLTPCSGSVQKPALPRQGTCLPPCAVPMKPSPCPGTNTQRVRYPSPHQQVRIVSKPCQIR